ncbi:hypothetical protein GCM10029963_53430 [Micromonospora andamanensis]
MPAGQGCLGADGGQVVDEVAGREAAHVRAEGLRRAAGGGLDLFDHLGRFIVIHTEVCGDVGDGSSALLMMLRGDWKRGVAFPVGTTVVPCGELPESEREPPGRKGTTGRCR